MSIRETSLWRRIFPIPTEDFMRNVVNRVNLDGMDKVVVKVHDTKEGDDPVFILEYEAMKGTTVMMRARDRVSAAEYRAALHDHDGDFHQDLEEVLENWVKEKVKDVEAKLIEAKVPVEIEYH